jgi:hypothetical protein
MDASTSIVLILFECLEKKMYIDAAAAVNLFLLLPAPLGLLQKKGKSFKFLCGSEKSRLKRKEEG